MATKSKSVPVSDSDQETKPSETVTTSELAHAFREAMEAAKPPQKKTPFNRVINTPWTPKDGSTKLKLKRKIFQHGLQLAEDMLTNEQISYLNKLRPGLYLDGYVVVRRRRDKGIDIDYPIKTVSQRLKLINTFGVRNFTELVKYCLEEIEKPRKSEFDLSYED